MTSKRSSLPMRRAARLSSPRDARHQAAEFKPKAFTTTGDLVLCELVSRGLGPASGVPIEWTTFAVVRVRTGKIAQVRVFLSREQALEAVGLRE